MGLEGIIEFLKKYDGPTIKIMEVCGTHTAAIFRSGIRDIISPKIKLVSGPGCPVCVTPQAYIDSCVAYALAPGHELLSFGDMFKVPGTRHSLATAKGEGGMARLMYSPGEAVALAEANPGTRYVVAAVGFETTAPAYALALETARAKGVSNIRLLTALKTVAPAMEGILSYEEGIDGFICPGHVSVVTGTRAYETLAAKYGKPFVVAGFEGEMLLGAIYAVIKLLDKESKFKNLYPSVVKPEGNRRAMALIDKYFTAEDAIWRGIGSIPRSGLYLREEYAAFDAGSRGLAEDKLPDGCRCGDVVIGRIDPEGCPRFGVECSPQNPLGPCMVSAEGACGIWHSYRYLA